MSEEPDLTPRSFVRYGDDGRVLERGVNATLILDLYETQGQQILRLGIGGSTAVDALLANHEYVVLVEGKPTLVDRPVWTEAPAPVAAGVEATIADLPACTVAFDGPLKGTQEHEGGDLAIGFTVPGTYTLSFEAFPFMPAVISLTVTAS